MTSKIASKYRRIAHPAAWKAADLGNKSTITFQLARRHLLALDSAVQHARRTGWETEQITSIDFPLDAIANDLAGIRTEVMHGRGIVILRGIPVERYQPEDIALLFWGLGTHFGHAVSQSVMGDRLGHVTDVSGEHPNERGYRSRSELSMHTDSDDIVMMLCLQNAKSGGKSRFSSSLAIHNEILANQPSLMEPLYKGFRYHWRGEHAPGEPPITEYRVPVFSERDGRVSCVYLRHFIEMAADELGLSLSVVEVAALDAFDELANREEFCFETFLEPGEAFLINNYTVLHSRTEFEDHADSRRKRHLLRLWIKASDGRPVVDSVRRYYRDDGIDGRNATDTLYKRP